MVADVLDTPLLTVSCKFYGALAVTVTAPGPRHVASPVEPMLAGVVEVFHESPSTCDSSRLDPSLNWRSHGFLLVFRNPCSHRSCICAQHKFL
jgi:hypothetical protein